MSVTTPNNETTKDLHEYLRTLPPQVLDRLYSHPATCLAVFRDLPHLAKHYVLRMLFVDQPVSQSVVSSWVSAEQHKEHQANTRALSQLRVWYDLPLTGGTQGWALTATFRTHLKVALVGGGAPWTGAEGSLSEDKYSKDTAFLDSYAKERWECILYFMVGSREAVGGVSRDIIDILLHAGMMKTEEGSSEHFITQAGFQFLLMDTPSQVWAFMLQYLATVPRRNMDLVQTLALLFQLSFSSVGKDYSTEAMTENQLRFLQHLREFGLVYQRKRKSQRYYPTRLAVNLASGLSKVQGASECEGYVMVETNYRLYAYTDSPLQVALLGLFSETVYRFQNLLVCNLTRESVREALTRGITAEQIINFLRSHAHPELRRRTPVLPPTITDMIRLWELERDRFKFSEGVLYNQFLSATDFQLLRDYARDLGVLIWDNPAGRTMIVSRGGHDDVKKFWKRQKNS